MTCIGLFGTCGNSKWRDDFMKRYDDLGLEYFNPQVDDWHPGLVEDENRHLAEDEIILFPVTDETTAQGSLAEIGFSIRQALRMNRNRYFIFMIHDECKDPSATEGQVDDSNRSRKLVKSKLMDEAEVCHNVLMVETLEEMLELSIKLARISAEYEEATIQSA